MKRLLIEVTNKWLVGVSLLALTAGCSTGGLKSGSSSDKQKMYLSDYGLESKSKISASEGQCGGEPDESWQKVDWKLIMANADQCVRKEKWDQLEKTAYRLLEKDVENPWGAYFLAVAAEGKRQYARAMWMLDLAGKKAGRDVAIFVYQRGRIWLALNEPAKAIGELERSVVLASSDTWSSRSPATTRNETLSKDKDSHQEKGSLTSEKKTEETEERRRYVLIDAHLFLADIYRRDFENDKAKNHYSAVLAIEPKNIRALEGMSSFEKPDEKVNQK